MGGEFEAPAPIRGMDTMHPGAPGDAAIAGLVAQLLQTTATLTVMVDEMMRFRSAGHSAPDAPPVIEVLGRLLCDVLPALLATHTASSIEDVTTVLLAAALLGERVRGMQRVGVVVALCGVVLISAGA